MNRKYIFAGLIGFAAILSWNIFLIQRDEKLYNSYYRHKAIENLKRSPSSEIGYSPKQKFCEFQTNWHPDCKVE